MKFKNIFYGQKWLPILLPSLSTSALISLVNNHYSFLVELLRVLTVMFGRKRLRLLLLMSCDSKMQDRKKGSRCSPSCFQERPHRNLKLWNDFTNENIIPEEWKEKFRMLRRPF